MDFEKHKKDFQNKNQNQNQELSFQDSWKQNHVELALAGAVIAGAAAIGAKGDLSDIGRYGTKTLRQASKGIERYLNRKLGAGGKFGMNVGRKVLRFLGKGEDTNQTYSFEKLKNLVDDQIAAIDEKELEKETKKRFGEIVNNQWFKHQEQGDARPFKPRVSIDKIREEVRTEMIEKGMQGKPNGKSGKTKNGNNSNDPSNPKKPFFKEQMNIFAGSAAGGLGLGAGLTAFHAIDRAIRQHDNYNERDKNFEIAGSFIKPQGQSDFKKTAGYRDFYEGLAGWGERIPQAMANGIGFTGISLGTAALLKKQREAETQQQQQPKGNRIIIELGEPDQENKGDASHAAMGGLGLMPRLAGEENIGLAKLAGIGTFLKNVGGRSGELRNLNARINEETINYRDEAAELLKNQDMDVLRQQRFGNLVHQPDNYQGAQDFFNRELLDSEAKGLKRQDVATREQIKDEVAKARLQTLGGLGLLGGTAGAIQLLKPTPVQPEVNV